MAEYFVADAGALPGDDYSSGHAINEAGDATIGSWRRDAGYGQLSDALWPRSGRLTPILVPPAFGLTSGINRFNEVSGWRIPARGPNTGFVWHDGNFWELGGPWADIEVNAINDAGTTVGQGWGSWDPEGDGWVSPTLKPLAWNVDNIGRELPTSTGSGVAKGVNQAGVIVGAVHLPTTGSWADQRPAVWTPPGPVMHQLPVPKGSNGVALDVNAGGQIVGVIDLGQEARASIWVSRRHRLLERTRPSVAIAINDHGAVVGEATVDGAEISNDNARAVLWQDGVATDLTDLVDDSSWVLSGALDINNDGDIIGWGYHRGQPRAFRLATVHRRQPTLADLVKQFIDVQLTHILLGVVLGQGGIVIAPGGRPGPVPPDGPFRPAYLRQLIPARARKALVAAMIEQLGSGLDIPDAQALADATKHLKLDAGVKKLFKARQAIGVLAPRRLERPGL